MTEETEVIFVSAEELAGMLTEAADGLTASEYTQMLEEVLADADSDVVAGIAEHMPPDLQLLLPKKFLH
jgi:hypothetical protein